MSTTTYANVKGLDELTRLFKEIPAETSKRVLKKGPSAAAKYVRDAVKAATPVGRGPKRRKGETVQAGTLKRSVFYFYKKRDSNANQAVFAVTFRRRTKKLEMDGFYAPWVEFGHRIVARFKGKYTDYALRGKKRMTGLAKRRRQSKGRVPAHPFFEPAVTAAAARAVDLQVEAMQVEMAKVVREKA